MERSIIITAICLILAVFLSGCTNPNESIAATVNGENILVQDIKDAVIIHNGYSYEDILENTIDETLVLQKAEEYKISISDSEFKDYLKNYKENFAYFFELGVEQYGEENYIRNIRIQLKYRKTKEYVLANVLKDNVVTNDDILGNIDIDTWNKLTREEREEAREKLTKLKEEEMFQKWVKDLRKNAEVIYSSKY